jgi:hypothetical protein
MQPLQLSQSLQLSSYDYYIKEFKNELQIKRIDFNNILRLINNQDFEGIRAIINDDIIIYLIDRIVYERDIVGRVVSNILKTLELLNDVLIIFNLEPQTSLKKARQLLKKKVFINIFDLAAGRYDRRMRTIGGLKIYLRNNPHKRYPLQLAKENKVLECFLCKMGYDIIRFD